MKVFSYWFYDNSSSFSVFWDFFVGFFSPPLPVRPDEKALSYSSVIRTVLKGLKIGKLIPTQAWRQVTPDPASLPWQGWLFVFAFREKELKCWGWGGARMISSLDHWETHLPGQTVAASIAGCFQKIPMVVAVHCLPSSLWTPWIYVVLFGTAPSIEAMLNNISYSRCS